MPLVSNRKTDRKPTYTHNTSVSNRMKMSEAFVAMGVNIKSLELYGTVEQMIHGEDLYRDGGVEVTWIPDIDKNIKLAPYSIPIKGKVRVESEKDDPYFSAELCKVGTSTSGKVIYELQNTSDIAHTCAFSSVESLKKFMALPSCKHRVAIACWVHDKLPEVLEKGDIEYIETTSFYKRYGLLPVEQDVREYFETIKNLKSADRNIALSKYFTGERVFKVDGWSTGEDNK